MTQEEARQLQPGLYLLVVEGKKVLASVGVFVAIDGYRAAWWQEPQITHNADPRRHSWWEPVESATMIAATVDDAERLLALERIFTNDVLDMEEVAREAYQRGLRDGRAAAESVR